MLILEKQSGRTAESKVPSLSFMPYLGKTPPNEELDKLMPWQLPNI